MTSGAIQKGVPTNVFLLICVSVSCPATPKSASFTSPCSESSTLAAAQHRTAGITLGPRRPHPVSSCLKQHLLAPTGRPGNTSRAVLGPQLFSPPGRPETGLSHAGPGPLATGWVPPCECLSGQTLFSQSIQQAGALDLAPRSTSRPQSPSGTLGRAGPTVGWLKPTPDTNTSAHFWLKSGPLQHYEHRWGL